MVLFLFSTFFLNIGIKKKVEKTQWHSAVVPTPWAVDRIGLWINGYRVAQELVISVLFVI